MEILKSFSFDIQRFAAPNGSAVNMTRSIFEAYTSGTLYYDNTTKAWIAATALDNTTTTGSSIGARYDGNTLCLFDGSTIDTSIASAVKINMYTVMDAGSGTAGTFTRGTGTLGIGGATNTISDLGNDTDITVTAGKVTALAGTGVSVTAGSVDFTAVSGAVTATNAYTFDSVTASVDNDGTISGFTGTSVTVGTSGAVVAPSGSAILKAAASGAISVLKNAVLTSAAGGTTLAIADSTSGDSVTAKVAGSTLTSSSSGEFTLTKGTFSATAGSYTIDATGGNVIVGTNPGTTSIEFVGGATGTYVGDRSFTLTSAGSVAEVKTSAVSTDLTDGTHVYTTNGAGTFKFVQVGSSTYLYDAAAVRVSATTIGDEILVASNGTTNASTTSIKFSTGSAGYITLTGGSYTIAGMSDGQKVTIDGREFTYANVGGNDTLTYGTTVYTFGVGGIQATIQGEASSFTDSFVNAVVTDSTRTVDANGELMVSLQGAAGTASVLGSSVPNFKDGDNVYYVSGTNYGVLDGSTISGAKALGRLNYDSSSDVRTYTVDSNSGAQIINLSNVGAGSDGTKAQYVWNIVGGNGADTIYGNAALASTLDGGSGNDEIHAVQSNVAFGGSGNDYIIGANAADISLSGGAGADTLVGLHATTTLTGGADADIFVLNDGTNAGLGVITDYSFAEGDVLRMQSATSKTDIAAANVNEGTVTYDGGTVSINGSNGNYQIKLQDENKKEQIVGWTGEEGSIIDFSAQTKGTVIIGNDNSKGDSLYGGAGADTIYGGTSDTIYGGAGQDTISLTAGEGAKTIGFGVTSGTSDDKVKGFANGFDTEAKDNLYLVGDASSLVATLTGSTLNLKMGNAKMELQDLTVGSNKVAEVLFGDAKAAFIASGNTGVISEADYAGYYWGTKNGTIKSGLDFSALDSDVEVNLSDTTTYRNISSLTGGTGNTTLMGSSEKETLVSGGGNTSLWGGAGNDVLQGKSGAKDMFFLLSGSGKDTVTSFEAYTESTSDTADVLYASDLTSAKAVSGAVELATSDGSKFTLNGLTNNSEIQYTTDGTNIAIAKLGSVSAANGFTYAGEVNFYGGGSKVDTLTVSDSDNHQIWLDNSKGGNVTFSSIEVVNGQSAQGDLLIAGNESVNTLIAGRGDASLWGGSGSAKDYLKGSTNGTTQFFYGYGEGNDTIVSSNADDVVNLLNITLANINGAATEITSSGVTLGMNDGSKLTVQTTKDITFSLADGSKYTANHNDKSWS